MLHKIVRFLTSPRKPTLRSGGGEEAVRNYALDLAQEWGEDWLKPIQQRLAKAYQHLSVEELDHYNAIAQESMKFGHELVYTMAQQNGKQLKKSEWQAAYLAKYSWVDEPNLSRLFSTGMYYAYKDGLI